MKTTYNVFATTPPTLTKSASAPARQYAPAALSPDKPDTVTIRFGAGPDRQAMQNAAQRGAGMTPSDAAQAARELKRLGVDSAVIDAMTGAANKAAQTRTQAENRGRPFSEPSVQHVRQKGSGLLSALGLGTTYTTPTVEKAAWGGDSKIIDGKVVEVNKRGTKKARIRSAGYVKQDGKVYYVKRNGTAQEVKGRRGRELGKQL